MKITKFLFALFVLFTFLTSCKKAAVDNSMDLQFQLSTVNRSANINAPVAVSNIQWISGFAWANQVKLEAKTNSKEIEFKATNTQRIDLFSSVAAAIGNISIPAGTYDEVEFKILLNPNGSDPALELKGQFTNAAGVVTPVIFRVNSLLEIKAEQNNITITDNLSTTALTTLDLSVLTNGVTQSLLNNASVSSGIIIISSSSNTSLYNIILANFQSHHEVEIRHH